MRVIESTQKEPIMDHDDHDDEDYYDGLLERVTMDPGVMGGVPTIRGTRVDVAVILNVMRHGYTVERVLKGYPSLAREDVLAAMAYAESLVRSQVKQPAAVS